MITQVPKGALDETVHSRLIEDIDRYADAAKIMPHWIWSNLSEFCSPDEIEWVRQYRKHSLEDKSGLVLVNKPTAGLKGVDGSVTLRMSAIAGALTRNFIFAQLDTLSSLVSAGESHSPPEASCLLIPNLYTGKAGIPSWKSAIVLDVLMARASQGKQTVVYVSDMGDMEADYGATFAAFIKSNYKRLEL